MSAKGIAVVIGLVATGWFGVGVGFVGATKIERTYPGLATYYEIGTSEYSHDDSLGVDLLASELDSVVVFVTGTGVPGEEQCGDLTTIRSTIVWWVGFLNEEPLYVEMAAELIAWNSYEFTLYGTYYPDPLDSGFAEYLQSDSALVTVALGIAINPGCWSFEPLTNATISEVTYTFYGDFEVEAQSLSWDAVKSMYR